MIDFIFLSYFFFTDFIFLNLMTLKGVFCFDSIVFIYIFFMYGFDVWF